VFELWQKCVLKLRYLGCRKVSHLFVLCGFCYRRVSLKFYFLYTYVAGKLESFQCSLKSATIWPEVRYLATLFSNVRYLCDTLGVAVFMSIKRLIPMLLRVRTALNVSCDTSTDFLAQKRKKRKKYSFRYRSFYCLISDTIEAQKSVTYISY